MHTHEDLRSWYGWAELSPGDPIPAGDLGRWRVTYHVGRYGIAAGGSLKLVFPAASDWPALQGKDPYEESFLTVTTTGPGRLAWRYEPRGYIQPWPKAVAVDVAQAGLLDGDAVTFYLGDPDGGSPGARAQTFSQRGYEFRIVVDAFATGQYVAVPSPTVDVVGGRPARLQLILPSRAVAGEPFEATLRLDDRWGNPSSGYIGTVLIEGLPGLAAVGFAEGDAGVRRLGGLRLECTGIHRARAREEHLGLAAESNPIEVGPPGAASPLPLWGDLNGQSAETCGANSADHYFRFGREVAALDFCAHQGNAYQVTDAFWRELQATARRHNAPGRFVAFLGYKWAGNTAGGGVRHVLFAGDEAPLRRCSRAQVPGEAAGSDCYPLPELHEALRAERPLLFVGAGSPLANLECHDPEAEVLLEVYTAYGEAPWLLADALRRGCKVGFVANSAGLQGRPGPCSPGAGEMVARGGLTCVYAQTRTRQAVWEALRSRRCYATTGVRLILDVEADGHPMGDIYQPTAAPRFRMRVVGTSEIERVEIHRGEEVVYRYPELDGGRPGWVRVVWGGAMARDWPRQVPWDGTLRCHGARVLEVRPYGIDSAARGIVLADEQAVSWRSCTAGNENGLLLHLDAQPKARLEFYAPLTNLTVALADLPLEQQLGGEGLHVRVEPWPQGTGQRDLELTWTERTLRPGANPYYVTVHQVDGVKAWSSPIYVCASTQLWESVV